MAWSWRFEDVTGEAITPGGVGSPEFAHQGDAESWLGETWRELLDAGIHQVSLYEDGRKVYGPMGLSAAD